MKLKPTLNMLASGQLPLAIKLLGSANEFYRVAFVSTAVKEGIYDLMAGGPVRLEALAEALNPACDREALRTWLDLGVSLGELRRGFRGYAIKGRFSRAVMHGDRDAYRALLQEVTELHYDYIVNGPALLKRGELHAFPESYGELIARSSRIGEPFILDVVEDFVPRSGDFKLLEVGCGSGIYLKHACRLNPRLTATGLELQPHVADFARGNLKAWGLEGRVEIVVGDVREWSDESGYDLVTLHQNIYYFPVDTRVELARRLMAFLRPGGKLVLTSGSKGGSPMMHALDICSAMTDGLGPLPEPGELQRQLKQAGFVAVQAENLIPLDSFCVYQATKP